MTIYIKTTTSNNTLNTMCQIYTYTVKLQSNNHKITYTFIKMNLLTLSIITIVHYFVVSVIAKQIIYKIN